MAPTAPKLGDRRAALVSHERAITLSRELQVANAANVELQVAVALALIGRAESHARFDDRANAARDYSEAVALLSRLQRAGTIEGTDVQTLEDARAAMARLGTTIGS